MDKYGPECFPHSKYTFKYLHMNIYIYRIYLTYTKDIHVIVRVVPIYYTSASFGESRHYNINQAFKLCSEIVIVCIGNIYTRPSSFTYMYIVGYPTIGGFQLVEKKIVQRGQKLLSIDIHKYDSTVTIKQI